ncbi:MAG: hypothetical protein KJ950_14555 [Proteobacteria bacterium]|nr:hypothetical protein [Pseudomonadota bacterium]MBU1688989.1 hypothetical protein [Pseudomonadota bacterium]
MRTTCESCAGTGQLNQFKGVSRFLLTVEECPVCSGLGFIITEEIHPKDDSTRGKKKKP